MDDMARRQTVAAGDLGVAGGATAKPAALHQQFRPRRAVNRTVDTAATQQRTVRRIDDGIDAQCRNIGDDDLEGRRADRSGE